MKTVTQATPNVILVPRFYPLLTDTLDLVFESGLIIPFTWIIDKNKIVITLLDTSELIQRDNYSFTLKRGQEIVYKGLMMFLKDGTDVQNYTNQSQDNKRWE